MYLCEEASQRRRCAGATWQPLLAVGTKPPSRVLLLYCSCLPCAWPYGCSVHELRSVMSLTRFAMSGAPCPESATRCRKAACTFGQPKCGYLCTDCRDALMTTREAFECVGGVQNCKGLVRHAGYFCQKCRKELQSTLPFRACARCLCLTYLKLCAVACAATLTVCHALMHRRLDDNRRASKRKVGHG